LSFIGTIGFVKFQVHQEWYPKSYAMVDPSRSDIDQVRDLGGNELSIDVQEGAESREESPAPQSDGTV